MRDSTASIAPQRLLFDNVIPKLAPNLLLTQTSGAWA